MCLFVILFFISVCFLICTCNSSFIKYIVVFLFILYKKIGNLTFSLLWVYFYYFLLFNVLLFEIFLLAFLGFSYFRTLTNENAKCLLDPWQQTKIK